ncbi:acetyltransferase [Bacillus sp. AK128]
MNIIIIGNGGHSKVVQDIIHMNKDYKLIAILDDQINSSRTENEIIYAPLSFIHYLSNEETKVLIAIGSNQVRKRITEQLELKEDRYITVIHPSAIISPSAKIGSGTVIMPNAVVNSGAYIGNHCIINTASVIEHDNHIEDFAHISPNATLTGNVKIEEGVHIGAAATVIPGKTVGSWSTVGAGSTVINDIQPLKTVVGSPTRIINKLEHKVI